MKEALELGRIDDMDAKAALIQTLIPEGVSADEPALKNRFFKCQNFLKARTPCGWGGA